MTRPRLIVITGRPGTGKTTLAKALVSRLAVGYLRIDAIETALQSTMHAASDSGSPGGADDHRTIGPEGYVVAHYLARSNLELGRDVIIDAVCPVAESRTGWADTAAASGARLIMIETALGDPAEHARRVSERRPDMDGQRVPTWAEVTAAEWEPWDETRDGPRLLIDTTSREAALATVMAAVDEPGRS